MQNQTLFPHPFSKGYWRTAASELKSTKMLVITALLIALRVALKPLAIPLGNPQLNLQTAMLATALGAMIFGPVVAIPAAIISDTIGFLLFPNGDYFLPFVLTEIASTMIYALCLYRSKVSAGRVILARFLICFVVNMLLQTMIIAWQYTYMGNPESAKNQILGIFTMTRLFKNLFFFPIESVVLTLFLKALMPATNRAGLTFDKGTGLRFNAKQIVVLVVLVAVGIGSAVGYLTHYYNTNSVTKDYTAEEVIERNKAMHAIILEQNDTMPEEKTVAVIESAMKPLFGKETTYTVAYYQAAEGAEITDNMWSYKKTPASKDKNLVRVATVTIVAENKTDEVLSYDVKLAK